MLAANLGKVGIMTPTESPMKKDEYAI